MSCMYCGEEDHSSMGCPSRDIHQECLFERAMKNEQKKPPNMRNIGVLVSCPCGKCNRDTM